MRQYRHIMFFAQLLALALGSLLLHGCANTAGFGETKSTKKMSKRDRIIAITSLKTGRFTADGRYLLSDQEKSQSCKRIKGKMNIRIVQLKRTGILRNSSALARKFSSTFGGKNHGLDNQARRRRQRAVLDAYNELLAKKKCPQLDLRKELSPDLGSPAAAAQKIGRRPQTR